MLGPNAAPEWQAGSLRWRSGEIMVARPIEGLVRSVVLRQTGYADIRLKRRSPIIQEGVTNGIVFLPWRR